MEIGAAELAQIQEGLTDQQKMIFMSQYASERKDRSTALILSILFGILGVDRFYIGDMGMGIVKLLTFGGCGVISLIDWFTIRGKADEHNRTKAQEIAASLRSSQAGHA